jgi:hypothetical protein
VIDTAQFIVNLSLYPLVKKLEGWDTGVAWSFYINSLLIKRINIDIIIFLDYFVYYGFYLLSKINLWIIKYLLIMDFVF